MAPAAWLLLAAGASALVAPVRRATTTLQASTARDVLWTPNPDYVKTTAMDRFQKAMQIDGTYEQLWDWSVSEPDQFWTRLQDFLDVEREGSDTPAREGETMPDVEWCARGVPRCCGAFTPSMRLVSIRRGRGWFLFRF